MGPSEPAGVRGRVTVCRRPRGRPSRESFRALQDSAVVKPGRVALTSISLFAAGFVFSCAWHEDRAWVQVDVTGDRQGARFSMTRCDRRSGPTGVRHLEIVELVAPDRVRERCAVSAKDLTSTATFPASWRMADPIPGFVIEGCAPLAPGSYAVSVRGHGYLGQRKFRVAADGQIQMAPGSCR